MQVYLRDGRNSKLCSPGVSVVFDLYTVLKVFGAAHIFVVSHVKSASLLL